MCRRIGMNMKTIFDEGVGVAPVDRQVQRAGQGGVGGACCMMRAAMLCPLIVLCRDGWMMCCSLCDARVLWGWIQGLYPVSGLCVRAFEADWVCCVSTFE